MTTNFPAEMRVSVSECLNGGREGGRKRSVKSLQRPAEKRGAEDEQGEVVQVALLTVSHYLA